MASLDHARRRARAQCPWKCVLPFRAVEVPTREAESARLPGTAQRARGAPRMPELSPVCSAEQAPGQPIHRWKRESEPPASCTTASVRLRIGPFLVARAARAVRRARGSGPQARSAWFALRATLDEQSRMPGNSVSRARYLLPQPRSRAHRASGAGAGSIGPAKAPRGAGRCRVLRRARWRREARRSAPARSRREPITQLSRTRCGIFVPEGKKMNRARASPALLSPWL